MKINVDFENTKEMLEFCRLIAGNAEAIKEEGTTEVEEVSVKPVAAPAAPVAVPTAPAAVPTAPASVPVVPAAVPTTPASVPVAPAAAPAAVPTSAPSYSLDDLARAAMTLMDVGRQGELQQLLQQFNVAALPMLPKEQYGAFATALRGMGAQI